MTEKRTCCGCDCALDNDVLAGHCPLCLLRHGFRVANLDDEVYPDGATDNGFGDYTLLEQIGRGGMGVVFKAHQRSLNRIVAMKMVRGANVNSPLALRRFQGEAETVALLDHPNIVPVFEVGEHQGHCFFSMKFVEGQSLAQKISLGAYRVGAAQDGRAGIRASQVKIATLIATVSRAVHYAHQHGVLHRDLKPSNILVDAQEQPHLTDFGVSKRLDCDLTITETGALIGTPSYMAPEQALGGKTTGAADIYSLGAVLYHLLTGQPPFVGKSAAEIIALVQHENPVAPRALNPTVPRDLETICLRCLEKDPRQRYETARELSEELERFAKGEPIQARPANVFGKTWIYCKRKPALALTVVITTSIAIWAVYSQWTIFRNKREAHEREDRDWALLFSKMSPVNQLHWSSEDLAGFSGQRPRFDAGAERLYIGIYLENDQRHMVSRFAPLLNYLEETLSTDGNRCKVDLMVYHNRHALEQALTTRDVKEQIHLGRIGDAGLSDLLRDPNAGLTPLVQQASGGKVSVVFTRGDTKITTLAELKGKRLALGNRTSTASGYELPKRLVLAGLTSQDLSAQYHDDSEENIERVLGGQFDAGVTRKDKFMAYTNAHREIELRILEEFPTARMPWVATKRLASETAQKLAAAMTALKNRNILALLPESSPDGFVAASAEQFHSLQAEKKRISREFFRPNASDAISNSATE